MRRASHTIASLIAAFSLVLGVLPTPAVAAQPAQGEPAVAVASPEQSDAQEAGESTDRETREDNAGAMTSNDAGDGQPAKHNDDNEASDEEDAAEQGENDQSPGAMILNALRAAGVAIVSTVVTPVARAAAPVVQAAYPLLRIESVGGIDVVIAIADWQESDGQNRPGTVTLGIYSHYTDDLVATVSLSASDEYVVDGWSYGPWSKCVSLPDEAGEEGVGDYYVGDGQAARYHFGSVGIAYGATQWVGSGDPDWNTEPTDEIIYCQAIENSAQVTGTDSVPVSICWSDYGYDENDRPASVTGHIERMLYDGLGYEYRVNAANFTITAADSIPVDEGTGFGGPWTKDVAIDLYDDATGVADDPYGYEIIIDDVSNYNHTGSYWQGSGFQATLSHEPVADGTVQVPVIIFWDDEGYEAERPASVDVMLVPEDDPSSTVTATITAADTLTYNGITHSWAKLVEMNHYPNQPAGEFAVQRSLPTTTSVADTMGSTASGQPYVYTESYDYGVQVDDVNDSAYPFDDDTAAFSFKITLNPLSPTIDIPVLVYDQQGASMADWDGGIDLELYDSGDEETVISTIHLTSANITSDYEDALGNDSDVWLGVFEDVPRQLDGTTVGFGSYGVRVHPAEGGASSGFTSYMLNAPVDIEYDGNYYESGVELVVDRWEQGSSGQEAEYSWVYLNYEDIEAVKRPGPGEPAVPKYTNAYGDPYRDDVTVTIQMDYYDAPGIDPTMEPIDTSFSDVSALTLVDYDTNSATWQFGMSCATSASIGIPEGSMAMITIQHGADRLWQIIDWAEQDTQGMGNGYWAREYDSQQQWRDICFALTTDPAPEGISKDYVVQFYDDGGLENLPASVNVDLVQIGSDGTETVYDTQTLTLNEANRLSNPTIARCLSDYYGNTENAWAGRFTDLPVDNGLSQDAPGYVSYSYQVRQQGITDFTTRNNMFLTKDGGKLIQNHYTGDMTDPVTVDIVKNWDDEEDAHSTRPASVSYALEAYDPSTEETIETVGNVSLTSGNENTDLDTPSTQAWSRGGIWVVERPSSSRAYRLAEGDIASYTTTPLVFTESANILTFEDTSVYTESGTPVVPVVDPEATGSITIHQIHNDGAEYDVYQIFTATVATATQDGVDTDYATHIAWNNAAEQTVLDFLDGWDADDDGTSDYDEWLTEHYGNTDGHDIAQNAAEFISERIGDGTTPESSPTADGTNTDPRTVQHGSFAHHLAQALDQSGISHSTAQTDVAYTGAQGYYLFVTNDATIGTDEAGTAPIWAAISGNKAKTINEKTAIPRVEKTVKDDANGATWGKIADANTNQDIDFRLEATLPSNLDAFDAYAMTLTDTLDTDEALAGGNTSSVRVYVDNGEERHEITNAVNAADGIILDGNVLTIALTDVNVANRWGNGVVVNNETHIVVEYQAHLLDTAGTGTDYTENTVVLTYQADPVTLEMTDAQPDYARLTAYALTLDKVDKATRQALDDAEFTIKTTTPAGVDAWLLSDGSLTTTEASAYHFTTAGAPGSFSVSGIDEGTYIIHEVSAPTNYDANATDLTVVVSRQFEQTAGTLTDLTATVSGGMAGMLGAYPVDAQHDGLVAISTNDGTMEVRLSNEKVIRLPVTGLSGNDLLLLSGLSLGLTMLAIIARKKMMEDNEWVVAE